MSFNAFHLYELYTREQVAHVLAPDYRFKAQTGTWGLHGIIQFGHSPNYVFFVTFGQSQGGHYFDEGVDENGILRWQSQPTQGFQDTRIQHFIEHDETQNDIILFLRTKGATPYMFLGKLKYVQHDAQRERPVYFQWKILDFHPTEIDLRRIGLVLEHIQNRDPLFIDKANTSSMTLVEVPLSGDRRNAGIGVSTREYQLRVIDYEERDRRIRKLGRLGEDLVLSYEIGLLRKVGKEHLAEKVEHIALTVGDSAGYDIRSFDPNDEAEVHIEVKTTTGPFNTPFYMSAYELEYSRRCACRYKLYRVFSYGSQLPDVQFFILHGAIEQAIVKIVPIQFKIQL